MHEEIVDRLDTSRLADDSWGGPRVVALLWVLAAIASEHRGWLDDPATFNLVRDKWIAALNKYDPKPHSPDEAAISKAPETVFI